MDYSNLFFVGNLLKSDVAPAREVSMRFLNSHFVNGLENVPNGATVVFFDSSNLYRDEPMQKICSEMVQGTPNGVIHIMPDCVQEAKDGYYTLPLDSASRHTEQLFKNLIDGALILQSKEGRVMNA